MARGRSANRRRTIYHRRPAAPRPLASVVWRWRMTLNLALEERWKRKRAILPHLKLRYPNDSELERLSTLAKVRIDERSGFADHIPSIVLDAHLWNASLRNLSTHKVLKTLTDIDRKASQLRKSLTAVDVGSLGSAERAGILLEMNLSSFAFREGLVLIPEFDILLDALAKAAREATKSLTAKRGPKGAGRNLAFDLVVQTLQTAAWQRGGDWTNYKKADGVWTGTFLEALAILKPYLPKGFFPPSVGRSVDHIKRKLIHHITKNTNSKP